MKLSISLFAMSLVAAAAFTNPAPFGSRPTMRHMSTEAGTDMDAVPITITGNNIELTPALIEYVNKKLERPLGKLATFGVACEVHLSVNKNPKVKMSHKIEVTTNLKGTTIHSKEETADMYGSIDAVVDRVARKLVKYKERRLEGWHGGKNMNDDMAMALEDIVIAEQEVTSEEEFVDPEAKKITKIKSFDLGTPISLDEAVFSLDYIDHDFFVFRNLESDAINVVYKRNAGGVGLIEPS